MGEEGAPPSSEVSGVPPSAPEKHDINHNKNFNIIMVTF
jgi:hypothetical protein